MTASTIYEPANSPLLHLESDHQYSTTFRLLFFREKDSSFPFSKEKEDGITRTKNWYDVPILDSKRISDRECPTKYLLQEDVLLTWETSKIKFMYMKGQRVVEWIAMLLQGITISRTGMGPTVQFYQS